jgi:YHS domain-containing protein
MADLDRDRDGTLGEDESGVAIDPICGAPVLEADAEQVEYKHRAYFFCSDRCRRLFERQAERIHVGELARSGMLFTEQKVRWGVA